MKLLWSYLHATNFGSKTTTRIYLEEKSQVLFTRSRKATFSKKSVLNFLQVFLRHDFLA